EVIAYRGSVAQPPVTVDAPATTATVTGLANKAKYTFRVAAIDAKGAKSKQSIPSSAVIPTAPGRTWYKSKRYWAAGLLILAVLAAGGVFFYRRHKKSAADAPATPSSAPPDAGGTEPTLPQEA